MTAWCPLCGLDGWTAAAVCEDCGAFLVDDRPPTWAPAPEVAIAELDLHHLDAETRGSVSFVLESNDVLHQWRGGLLALPASAVGLVEAARGRHLT